MCFILKVYWDGRIENAEVRSTHIQQRPGPTAQHIARTPAPSAQHIARPNRPTHRPDTRPSHPDTRPRPPAKHPTVLSLQLRPVQISSSPTCWHLSRRQVQGVRQKEHCRRHLQGRTLERGCPSGTACFRLLPQERNPHHRSLSVPAESHITTHYELQRNTQAPHPDTRRDTQRDTQTPDPDPDKTLPSQTPRPPPRAPDPDPDKTPRPPTPDPRPPPQTPDPDPDKTPS